MAEKILNECNDKNVEKPSILDPVSPNCDPGHLPSLKDVAFDNVSERPKRLGIGHEANCSPMQRGWGSDLSKPSRETISRYSQSLRGCQEAMKELFSDLIVYDEEGVAHPVPIIIAAPEKAVAFILQENVRKDSSFVVDRIKLPILSIHQSDVVMNQQRYLYSKFVNYYKDRATGKPQWVQREVRERDTIFGRARGIPVDVTYQLNAWTLYREDMNQIIEQIFLKFDPIAYIKIQDINEEIIVKLDSTNANIEIEPGDKEVRVVKYNFNMTVEMFIPQPIVRKKAVLDIKADILHGVSEEEVQEVLSKLEITVKE
jgi:hypothetical protein